MAVLLTQLGGQDRAYALTRNLGVGGMLVGILDRAWALEYGDHDDEENKGGEEDRGAQGTA